MKTDRTRIDPEQRKQQILEAALALAADQGYTKVRWSDVAQHLGISRALVMHYFKTMSQLQTAIMRAAVKKKNLKIIAQGLALDDRHARRADPALQKKAAASVLAA
jgi:AcrR family transcriptional regulator